MPITYTWAEVEPVHVEQYITAERNNEQKFKNPAKCDHLSAIKSSLALKRC